jgi:predicted aspartyl protease
VGTHRQSIAAVVFLVFYGGLCLRADGQAVALVTQLHQLSTSWAQLGDTLFRQSNFDEAQAAYHAASLANPQNARAYWGLARLAKFSSRAAEAKLNFAKAFQLSPRDPDVILSYLEFVDDPESRIALLRNFLSLSEPRDTQRREHVTALLEMERRLGGRHVARVTSTSERYQIRLMDFVPETDSTIRNRARGFLVEARINGGKKLRFLLDTGADGVVLDSRVAKKSDLEFLVEARLGGFGTSAAASGQVALARSISIGGFELENCVIHTMDLGFLAGTDGVIGTNLFKDYLLRIDSETKTLDLSHFPDTADSTGIPAYRIGPYLLVSGAANKRSEGYFLLDTGASFTLLAPQAAETILPTSDGRLVELLGVRGEVYGHASPAWLTIAGHLWFDSESITADLNQLSQQTGVQILGVLGYPLLRQSALTINYRDGQVEFYPEKPGTKSQSQLQVARRPK